MSAERQGPVIREHVWPPAAGLVLLAVAAYQPVLANGFVNFDDPAYLTANPQVAAGWTAEGIRWAFTTFHTSNWLPVTWLSHMLDVELFGLEPAGHHAMNVALHAANSVLLYRLLLRATAAFGPSLAVAALFAVHPLGVESVAWASERKNVLCTLFGFAMLHAHVSWAARPEAARALLVAVFFALGLMSKPMVVTFPFVLLLLDYWPLARLGSWREIGPRVLEKLPLFAMAAAGSSITLFAQRGAMEAMETPELGARIGNALVSYAQYLGMAVVPAKLAVLYPHPSAPAAGSVAAAIALLAAISGLALAQARARPYLIVGWLWFLGTLVPVIGLVQVGTQALADRYTYVPLVGVFVMVAWSVAELWRTRVAATRDARAIAFGSGITLTLVALTLATRVQSRVWRDSVTLFEHTLAVTERNPLAHTNLGVALGRRGRVDEAIGQLRQALALQPGEERAHYALGLNLLRRSGAGAPSAQVDVAELREAIRELEVAARLAPERALTAFLLGIAYTHDGRSDDAARSLAELEGRDPALAAKLRGFIAGHAMPGEGHGANGVLSR